MDVINQNLKELNKGYVELSCLTHELVTDCWGPDQQAAIEAKVDAQAVLMDEKARVIREMICVFRKKEPSGP
jgi:hypothetical protein